MEFEPDVDLIASLELVSFDGGTTTSTSAATLEITNVAPVNKMSLVMRNRVFGSFRPGQTQTGLLSYRS